MAYRKPPPLVVKIMNPLAMKLGGRRVAALVVTGRRSGLSQRVPVVVVDYEGRRYLVSPRGETDWVKNLRAAKRAELIEGRHSTTYSATEVETERRGPIIAAYRAKAGWTVASLFKQLPDDRDHPVFELT